MRTILTSNDDDAGENFPATMLISPFTRQISRDMLELKFSQTAYSPTSKNLPTYERSISELRIKIVLRAVKPRYMRAPNFKEVANVERMYCMNAIVSRAYLLTSI